MFCYPIYKLLILKLSCFNYYPRLKDILYYTCLMMKWPQGIKVQVIREDEQLDINLLIRHFNHVKMLLAILCDWD